jgi:hypothetical protein
MKKNKHKWGDRTKRTVWGCWVATLGDNRKEDGEIDNILKKAVRHECQTLKKPHVISFYRKEQARENIGQVNGMVS